MVSCTTQHRARRRLELTALVEESAASQLLSRCRDEGVAAMRAARDVGITFLDDARYDDETIVLSVR
jgi:hypothetical protein